jgi:hypothetical protein
VGGNEGEVSEHPIAVGLRLPHLGPARHARLAPRLERLERARSSRQRVALPTRFADLLIDKCSVPWTEGGVAPELPPNRHRHALARGRKLRVAAARKLRHWQG